MRDYVVTLLIFGSLPFILARPYIGVLVWSWISYMNPHRLTWGFAYDMPFAKFVAAALFLSLLFNRDIKKPPVSGITIAWLFLIVWMGITTAAAIYPDFAWVAYQRILKIQIILLLMMMIMRTPERIHMMIWVIFLSIGFFGIKGGIFTIMTGGSYRIWGPEISFISDNNHLAVALLMVLPFGYYLFQHESRSWLRWTLVAFMGLIAISVVASYSRGAFLAIISVAFFLWLKSQNRAVIGLGVLPLLPLLFLVMPEAWYERMSTIGHYEQDASAMGRLNSWTYAINAANARITGAGLESWSGETFSLWAPDPTDVHAAHSIYFSVLADHGWVGLLLFVGIFIAAWRMATKIIAQTKADEHLAWMADLSRMLQVSLVAYAVGGAFLSLAYFDLPWHIVCILVIMRTLLSEEAEQAALRGSRRHPQAQATG